MHFVLDMTARPGIVVIATDDIDEAHAVANKYAQQTGAALTVADGDPPVALPPALSVVPAPPNEVILPPAP